MSALTKHDTMLILRDKTKTALFSIFSQADLSTGRKEMCPA